VVPSPIGPEAGSMAIVPHTFNTAQYEDCQIMGSPVIRPDGSLTMPCVTLRALRAEKMEPTAMEP